MRERGTLISLGRKAFLAQGFGEKGNRKIDVQDEQPTMPSTVGEQRRGEKRLRRPKKAGSVR